MQKIFRHTSIILILSIFPFLSHAEQLKFVAEELPPFHFFDIDIDKKPTGALVEVIEALMIRTKLSGSVEFMPFARSYNLTLKNKNTFMISLMNSPDRKNNFQWIGQIYKSKAFLVGLNSRSDININNLEEAKSFVVGTIRGYHSEKYLKIKGFTTPKNLHLSVNYKHMWSMLFGQRIDFILTNFVAIDTEMKSIGLDKKDIKTSVELHDFPGDLFIATGLNTSGKTVSALSLALKQIKADGTYKKIMDKWGL
jgi:polar amino acid transport system substrate-binding protein